MVAAAAAQELRLAQVGIATLFERDLAAFWFSLDLTRPELARDALLQFVPALTRTYGESAAVVAADWYDAQRALERVPGRFRAVMMPSPYQDAVEPMVRRAAGALFTEAPGDALLTLQSSSGKYALGAGRQTIVTSTERDPRTAGWQRVVRAGACDFCVMLHGRGGVYKESTAHFAAHKACRCVAVPSWDQDAPEVPVSAYVASRRTSAMSAEERERHNAALRAYLAN